MGRPDPEAGSPAVLHPHLAEQPGHLVWRAHARVVVALGEVLPPGVDIHAYAVLLALAGGATRSQQEVARMTSVSRTTMVKVAADLAGRGLVERVRDARDRRSYALTRTPEGAAAARRWRRHAEDLEDRLTAGLSVAEREDLRSLLARVAEPELAPDCPDQLRESIGFLVTRVHRRMYRDFSVVLQPLRIDPRHIGALLAVNGSADAPMAQAELARNLGVSGPSVVQIVDDLEALGLAERHRDPRDRRTQLVRPTPATAAHAARAREAATELMADLLGALDLRERERLVRLLQAFVTAA